MRQSAQDEGKLSGGFCSPLKDDEDKLAGVEDAAGRGSAATADQRRSGVVGARLLRASGT
jgi:hypothetical protein